MRMMTTIARDISAGAYEGVIYQAGMDVLLGDPSGGGILSYRQAHARDEMVFVACHESHTPVAWNYAGGYKTDEAGRLTPVLAGHLNTVLAACKVFERLDDDVVSSLATL